MELKIYDKQGIVKMTVSPGNSSQWSHEVGVENVVTVNFTTWEFLVLEVGWYILVEGQRFSIKSEYRPKHIHDTKYTYNLKFYGREHDAQDILFCRLNQGEDDLESVFAYDGTPMDFLQKVVANMNRITDGVVWKAGEAISANRQTINFNGLYCWDALGEIARAFGTEWWMDGEYLNISKCERGESVSLGYGQGLKSGLTQNENTNAVKWFTRLIPVGSSKNIDKNKYGYATLQLPGREKYIDINTQYGLKEYREEAAFSEIYPHRVGTISSVRSEERTNEETGNYTVYYVKDSSLPFNPDEYMIGGEIIHMTFNSGALAGKDFEVNWNNDTKEFEIINQYPDENAQLPGGNLVPSADDTYVLWNISMPDEYIRASEQELKTAVDVYLAEYSKDISVYSGNTDYIYISKNDVPLLLGQRVRLLSEVYFGNIGRDSRITRVSRKLNNLNEATIDCSDAIASSWKSSVDSSLNQLQFSVSKELAQTAIEILKVGDTTTPSDYNVLSALRSLKTFLRKDKDEETPFKISVGDKLTAKKGIQIGKSFIPGIITGSGGFIDEKANAELESLIIRRFLEVPELRYNRVQVTLGDKWNAAGAGVIERVVPDSATTGTVFLKLEEGEYGAIAVDDICMGIFHSDVASENATEDYDDSRGNFQFAGFYTCYFRITGITGKDNKQFTYSMRPTSDRWKMNYHPREAMHFVCYGNFTNIDRQTSAYTTRTYTRLLKNQDDWEISSKNIAMQWGDMGNMSIHGIDMKGYSIYTTNIYNKGIIKQVKDNGEDILTANDRGSWVSGTTYDYYDRVSHNGSLWLCVNESGTNSEPTKTNSDWLLQVASGESLKAGGRFSSNNTPYAPNSIVDFAEKAWITTDTVSDAPYPIWTDNNGNRLMFSDGGFCLVDDSAINKGWQVLLDTGTLKDGEDGKSLIVQWSADGVNWHDEFITGDIYMRQKVGEDAVWSGAIRIAGEKGAAGENGEYTEYEFAVNDSLDTAPTSGWNDTPPTVGKGQYLWMRMRVVQGDGTVGNWSEPVRIGGEKGDSIEFVGRFYTGLQVPYLGIVQMGNANWAAKKATTNPPLWCWTDESGNRLQFANGGFIITGEENTEYELMVANGKDGSDGNEYEYIYINTATDEQPSTPTTEQVDDYVPSGWHDDPVGVSSDIPYEWVSQRRKKNGIWGDFSNPSVWAKYGEDGTNWEFIYQRAIEYYIPSTPETRQQDDYVPSGWTDDPTGVSESVPYEWMSKRAKKNGIWGAFSTPALWAKYGEKGQKGDKGDTGGVGYTGCVTRVFQEYDLNRNYRNDTNAPSDELEPSGIRYLDVVLVPNDNVTSGYDAYECLITNTGISLKNTEYWREMSNAGSQFIPKLVALDAHIRFASSGQLVILDENNEPCAGLSGSQDGHKIRIWAGSYDMQTAPFRVTQEGHLIANNATITGVIKGATIEGELIVGTGAYKAKINPSGNYPSITWGDDSHPYVWIGMNTPTGGYLSGQITLKNVLNSSAILTPSSIMLTGDHNFGVEINASGINESRISATRFIAGGGRYIASIGLDANNRIRLGASYWPTSSSQVNVGEVYSDNGTLKIRTT